MEKETLDRVENILRELASELGTTGEYLWEVLVKQAGVSAVATIFVMSVWLFVGMICLGVSRYYCVKFKEKGWDNSSDREDILRFVPMAIGGFCIFILFIFSLTAASEVITKFLNPEYWALNEILRRF